MFVWKLQVFVFLVELLGDLWFDFVFLFFVPSRGRHTSCDWIPDLSSSDLVPQAERQREAAKQITVKGREDETVS